MTDFSRTASGLVAEYKFHRKVLVWIEGDFDVPFYRAMLGDGHHLLKIANGKPNSQILADAVIREDLPYVVILDGDYDFLSVRKSPHRRVVLLRRYSIENYLFSKEVIQDVSCDVCCDQAPREEASKIIDHVTRMIRTPIRKLMSADIAAVRSGIGVRVLPKDIGALVKELGTLEIDPDRISKIYNEAVAKVDRGEIRRAKKDLSDYLAKGEIEHVVRGHLLFSILRAAIKNVFKAKMGRNLTVEDRALYALLSIKTWSCHKSKDHNSLIRKIRRAILDARAYG